MKDFNSEEELKAFLDRKVVQYNQPGFIANDPICIPHLFTKKQDIEIMGFWASILAWGQRVTIINKSKELIALMDGAPYDFVLNHQESDLKRFEYFKHRTFNYTDTLYFIRFFKEHYKQYDSLEDAFLPFAESAIHPMYQDNVISKSRTGGNVCYNNLTTLFSVESSLNFFRSYFFSLEDYPKRTIKHISSPMKNATCKRINMFLRWMVRKDNCGVDFGIWERIKPAQLICPCDVHVDRVARKLGLIERRQTDWKTALELTENLKRLDAEDPVKYDFALFGLGVEEKF